MERNKKLMKSALSLQTHLKKHTKRYHLTFPKVKDKKSNNFSKRMSSVISSSAAGSLTIEAALVLPVFLFAIMAILSFTEILRLQMKIDSAMQQCAKELAVYGYAEDALLEETVGDFSFATESLFSETYIKNSIISQVGEEYINHSPAESTGSIHFIGSRIMEEDRIEIRCTYYVTPFFSLSPKAGFLTGTTAVARAFTGYDNLSATDQSQKEEYVYVTTYGTVYHRDRGCSYLDLSIEKIFVEDIGTARNADGSKYQACALCGSLQGGSIAFVTSYGDCYHNDILCSGLRRTIEAIPISQVGNRTPCTKCGY